VQVFYANRLRAGLSSSTVHHIHGMLHRALKDALQLGLVQRNVTEMVRVPRRQSLEMITLSESQAQALLEATREDRFAALYVLALTTGMRQGELLGLRWQDVDLDRALLSVRMNVQEADGRFILAEVKTAYSRRNIALTQRAVAALRAHRAHRAKQNAERERMGDLWNDRFNLVFPNGFGGIMIPPNTAKRSYKRHLVAAGIPRETRFHDIRHTHATQLLAAGVNVKVVSERLGHADVSTTLRVYTHVLPRMQQTAVEASHILLGSYEPGKPAILDSKLVSELVSG